MKKAFLVGFLLCGVAWAGDAQRGKLLDVKTFQVVNDSPLGRWAASDGGSALIPATREVVALTIQIDAEQVTANFIANKHFSPAEFVVGESIEFRLEKDKLVVKGANGKDARGKVVRRELTSLPASPQSASR